MVREHTHQNETIIPTSDFGLIVSNGFHSDSNKGSFQTKNQMIPVDIGHVSSSWSTTECFNLVRINKM